MSNRSERRWSSDEAKDPPDPRTPGQRDRDRVLYTSQFRRLGEVTQVVGSHEMELFHNRLTHTLEVAQVARRLAERWADSKDLEVDPDVVEAAALAHDLGHPPFGHIAEKHLDDLLVAAKIADGFEGNAQSFRIITKLARRSDEHVGLDLSRAALQATSKYPWRRDTAGKKNRKYGAYHPEGADFDWSREGLTGPAVDQQTPEARIMDWADDVAYALHDVDDFFSAGLVPLDRLARDPREQAGFLQRTFDRWKDEHKTLLGTEQEYTAAAETLFSEFPTEPWGNQQARGIMSRMVAVGINRYVTGLSLDGGALVEDPDMRRELDLLKSLTWTYVIEAPALAAQQEGQRRVIETLLDYYVDCTDKNQFALPAWARAYLSNSDLVAQHSDESLGKLRVACDVVASLSERQALALYGRLTGHDAGSVVSSIVR
ncbi:dGTPase [Pedococcus dokdonensis]|uniref:dGTPase n=1 Tax=Pedococcus dokdonensis TaxID=443156 RepID=A0A1H0N323_9MICO|nr:dNTP triphosphohydrolase [Pedococcus dokdonensis]SDO87021.1 dGTPase [Pedococcus dokdonensis]